MPNVLLLRRLAALVLSGALAGCVSIDHETDVSVWSFKDVTQIEITVPAKGVEFNFHYLGWVNKVERFELTVPRHRNTASGAEMTLVQDPRGTQTRLPISAASLITIAAGPTKSSGFSDCKLTVKLLNAQGDPYPFNGEYRDPICNL